MRAYRTTTVLVALAMASLVASCASGGGPERSREGRPEVRLPPGEPVAITLQALEPLDPFPASEFEARRSALMAKMGGGVAVLLGAGSPDGAPFVQDADFYYLTGVETPGAALILDAGSHTAHLFLSQPTTELARMPAAQLAPGPEAARRTGIAAVHPRSELQDWVGRVAANAEAVWLQQPAAGGGEPVLPASGRGTGLAAAIRARFPDKRIEDVGTPLAELRWVKSALEQEYERRAGLIAALGMNEAVRSTRPGYYEWEIASAAAFVQAEMGQRTGAEPRVSSGLANAATSLDRRIHAGDLLRLQNAADYHGYDAVVARTWGADGNFTQSQMPFYLTAGLVHDSVIAAIKPGVTVGQLLAIAQRVARGRAHQAAAWATEHGYIGHFTGLAAEDPAPPDAMTTRPLRPGVVFTVASVIDAPEADAPLRIEDTVLVTADGHEVLTSGTPLAPPDLLRLYLETGVVEWWKGQEGISAPTLVR